MRQTSLMRGETDRLRAVIAPRVLVIDGDVESAASIAGNLTTEGYRVETVERGDEAEASLAKIRPTSSFSTGRCPAFRASRSAGGCAPTTGPASFRLSW